MKIEMPQSWPENASQGIALQKQMASRIRLENSFGEVRKIAGIDVSYDLKTNLSRAVVCVFEFPSLILLESVMAHEPTVFPYITGLLSFREIPVLLAALKCVTQSPDLIMVDGMGYSHPRRMGIASHLGLILNIPTIGVGKSLLCGKFHPVGAHRGDTSILTDRSEKIGTVLRSKDNTKPLFISPGHLISHESSVEFVLRCLTRYRLPEPTHTADKFSKIRPGKAADMPKRNQNPAQPFLLFS